MATDLTGSVPGASAAAGFLAQDQTGTSVGTSKAAGYLAQDTAGTGAASSTAGGALRLVAASGPRVVRWAAPLAPPPGGGVWRGSPPSVPLTTNLAPTLTVAWQRLEPAV